MWYDDGLDWDLESQYEDRYPEPYMGEDYNVFEENQIALDREFDLDYYEDDEPEYDPEYDDGEPQDDYEPQCDAEFVPGW